MGGIRTDLAVEAIQINKETQDLSGIEQQELRPEEGICINIVDIKTDAAGKTIGKKKGKYITMDLEKPFDQEKQFLERSSTQFASQIKSVISSLIKHESTILVVGLGNKDVTADSLGPKVIDRMLVTRHIKDNLPDELIGGLESVCAIAPGVLGVTGIETAEVIRGIIDKIKPAFIIAIDSLAARSIDRIVSSMQVSDTGINPGSGLGNKRKGITQETMGVPVIAIGVPMVVYASTITHDMMEQVLKELKVEKEQADVMLNFMQNQANNQIDNLVVAPKDVDQFVNGCADMVADAINMAIHPDTTLNEVKRFM